MMYRLYQIIFSMLALVTISSQAQQLVDTKTPSSASSSYSSAQSASLQPIPLPMPAPISPISADVSSVHATSFTVVPPLGMEESFSSAAVLSQPSPLQMPVSKISTIFKSDNDSRNYRYITLSNGLRVLLISDPLAEKSAAALNVHVGSHQDPKRRLGLAHFLEHMLFLGTEKYPKAGEYQDFITQHGGESNAHTAAEHTQFFFDIEHAFLDPALDRFAQFFSSPLFNAEYIEREKNAVHAEYLANLNDDAHREWDVYRNVFNPEHPASHFSLGNLELLADQEGHSTRDDLLAFYQEYYSANLMTLVVLSNQKLNDLQAMVESDFLAVPNRNKQVAEVYPSLFADGRLPAIVSVKPVQELRRLRITFPVPSYTAQYQSKPWQYIARFLGDEGTGSVLSLLKELGWAESLEVGEIYQDRQNSLFQVSISLTKDGLKAKEQIVSIFFDYIKLLSTRGISDWRFNEMGQLSDFHFRFHEKMEAIEVVSELAQVMQDYPAKDVLLGRFNYSKFDKELLEKALTFLRSDNALITIVAPDVHTQNVSQYYQAPYSINVSNNEAFEEEKTAHRQKLSLPERNVFVPKNIALKTASMLPMQEGQSSSSLPSLIVSNDQLQLWFLQDTLFRTPKAELNFRFKLPMLNNSLENAARLQLFSVLLMDQLNEYAHPARLAGLTFSFSPHARGLDINVKGYTDKQSLLVNKIVASMYSPEFTQTRFDKIKENMVRQWRNEERNLPHVVLTQKIHRLQYLPYWGARELAESLQSTTFEQLVNFSGDVLRGAKVDAFFYGNMYPQEAIKLVNLIDRQLMQKASGRMPQLAKVLRVDNKANKSWLYVQSFEHKDTAVELYVSALSNNADDAAHMLLLTQLLEAPFYNELRTEKQLGSVVSVAPMPIRDLEASLFVVQSSNASPENIMAEINRFLVSAPAHFPALFSENKAALLAQLREPVLSLHEQSEIFWQAILLNDVNFTRKQELIAAVNKISLQSLQKYYEAAFLQKNHRLWISSHKIDAPTELELIQNVADYQQKLQGYLYP